MILSNKNISSSDVNKIILEHIEQRSLESLLLVVPTNRRVRALRKLFISKSPGQTVSKFYIETLTTLSQKLTSACTPFTPLSEAASSVFIKQSCSEVELKYLINYRDEIPSGTLDRLKNVISEYKRHGITPEVLLKEAQKLSGSERLKAQDIVAIYCKFNEKCVHLNLFDVGDLYSFLNSVVKVKLHESFQIEFPKISKIIVSGFDELTSSEISLISRLANLPELELIIQIDYFKNNRGVFQHLGETIAQLTKSGFNITSKEPAKNEKEFLKFARENLFYGNRKFQNEKNIFSIAAQSRKDEIEKIAKKIKILLIRDAIEPSKICVSFNLINNYSNYVRDTFTIYGIPFNLTDRLSLSNAFPVIAVINFLEILESDFYYKSIFRSVSSGFFDLDFIDSSNLHKTAAELKVISGRYNWINKIDDAIKKLSLEKNEINQNKIQALKKAKTDLTHIFRLLQPFDKKNGFSEFTSNLVKLIKILKLDKSLVEESFTNEEYNIKSLTTFIETTVEVFRLLEDEYPKNQKFEIAFFLDHLRTISNWAKFNIKEKSEYGVQVTTVDEIRGLNFEYLFIAGLTDGDFPTKYNPEIFISGSYQRKEFQHQAEERYKFFQTLKCWDKQLYLSFPIGDGNKDLTKSSFLKEFENTFDIVALDSVELDNYIFSEQKLFEEYAQNPSLGYDKHLSEPMIKIIDTAIEIDKVRNSTEILENEFSGNLLEPHLSAPFSKEVAESIKKLSENYYSISQLETYAKCPFNYFLSRILKLDTMEEPSEEIENIEIGSLLHNILFKFYTKLREEKIFLTNCTDEVFFKAKDILFKIAREELENDFFVSPISFFEREKILGIGGIEEESILYKFLLEEHKDNKFYPTFFEAGFGKLSDKDIDYNLINLSELKINGIKLKGKIDRIDINNERKSIEIIDYKLGGASPSKKDLEEGISLQLPVYLYAARELLKFQFEEDYQPELITIYSLKFAQKHFGKKDIKFSGKRNPTPEERIETNNQLIDHTKNKIQEYVNNISVGRFGLSTLDNREEKACKYCQFSGVCRVRN